MQSRCFDRYATNLKPLEQMATANLKSESGKFQRSKPENSDRKQSVPRLFFQERNGSLAFLRLFILARIQKGPDKIASVTETCQNRRPPRRKPEKLTWQRVDHGEPFPQHFSLRRQASDWRRGARNFRVISVRPRAKNSKDDARATVLRLFWWRRRRDARLVRVRSSGERTCDKT